MRMKYVFTQISTGKSFLIWILDNFMVTHYENTLCIFGVLQIYLFSDINIICSLKKTISKRFYVSSSCLSKSELMNFYARHNLWLIREFFHSDVNTMWSYRWVAGPLKRHFLLLLLDAIKVTVSYRSSF